MKGPARSRSMQRAPKRLAPGIRRNRLAFLQAVVTVVCLGAAFVFARGTQFLMPGPLSSAHGAIEACSSCHTSSGSGKLSWLHGLLAGDPLADSKACLTCHTMPSTAFNAHGASEEVLKESTGRLTQRVSAKPQPFSARAQAIAFPTSAVVARDLYCATCHQEHQGAGFDLARISNEQCRSCHAVKFDSFDGNHPPFDNYPFDRRTRIVFDHAGHFGKHYPEMAKRVPPRRIPETCSSCHNSNADRRLMAVAPFDATCATCHLDQITGKEQASGPKGIAFLALPGLDRETLKARNAPIGEWPDASEASLTPFMLLMLGRDQRGRDLIKAVAPLNLQELGGASDVQIEAVAELAWEIKGLFHALIEGKASDVLGDIDIGGAKPGASLAADLTAGLPRDVVVSAQQEWLPNLATEMASRNGGQTQGAPDTTTTEPQNPETPSGADEEQNAASAEELETSEEPSQLDEEQTPPEPGAGNDAEKSVASPKLDPPPCTVSILGQCLLPAAPGEAGQVAAPQSAGGASDNGSAGAEVGEQPPSSPTLGSAMRAGLADLATEARPEGTAETLIAASDAPEDSAAETSGETQPQARAGDQADDLLFPTEEELREMKARRKDAGQSTNLELPAGTPDAATAPPADAATPSDAASATAIESNVDPESWADHGGWYRQDYTIFYRPAGHKDKFIYSWLLLAGRRDVKGRDDPSAAIFAAMTGKGAPGSCTKCHSIEGDPGEGRAVNFSPLRIEAKQGRFTSFVHEPHFGVTDDRGCLTCHALASSAPSGDATAGAASDSAAAAGSLYLKSYEQGDPQVFAPGFAPVSKDTCLTCHTAGKARQDCLTCHKYHVNGVISPITATKNSDQ